jgi:DinB family
MDQSIKDIIWHQFGASIDMLINAIASCPADYFMQQTRFYYVAFHSTIFLDYYLSIPPSTFDSPLAFTPTLPENCPPEAIGDLIPIEIYPPQALLDYLKKSREKCQKIIANLGPNIKQERFTEGHEAQDMDYPILETLLYNMRHTQHHAAQLNLMLRQDLGQHTAWSFRAGDINW